MNLASRAARAVLRLRNRLDFTLRQSVRLRRAVNGVRADSLVETLGGLPGHAVTRAQSLIDRYRLAPSLTSMRAPDQLETLAYADLLDTTARGASIALPPGRVSALDIGASHWLYAAALHGFLTMWGGTDPRAVELIGVEIDPWRMYGDGHTRHDWARWYSRDLPGATYSHGDARTISRTFVVVTMLFPFVAIDELDRWGLPESTFEPVGLLRHAWSVVAPDGYLIVVNQGQREAAIQRTMYRALGIAAVELPAFESPFLAYRHPRVAFVSRRVSSP